MSKPHLSSVIFPEKSLSRNLSVLLFLAVVLSLIYSNTFGVNFVFDDDGSIVSNELIHIYQLSQLNFTRLAELFKTTRSVAQLTFALNFYFGHLNVFGFHLVNLIIHILASWTVYLFIRATMTLAGSGKDRAEWIAVVASALFAVHPVQTQAVTYVVQRETSMATLFYLWAFLTYIHARTSGNRKFFIVTLLFFLLAVGTKQNAAILPFILLGYEFYFFQKFDIAWLKKNLFPLGGAILAPVILGFFYTGPNMLSWIAERYAERSFTLTERVLTQNRVILHYLTLLFYPAPSRLNLDYDFPVSHGLTPATVIAMAFIVLSLILMVCLARSRPVISFVIFWFFGNLFIESSILALEMVYEHRIYLPSIGFFLLFALLCYDHILRFPQRRHWGAVGLVILGLVCCISTFERNKVWKDDMSLWSDALKKSPNKSRPHNNLGNAYLNRGNPRKAIEHHLRAIALDEENHDAYYNLANDYLKVERLEDTIGYYKKAVELKPDYAKAYANLGTVYNMMGRYDDAIEQALLALKYRPHYVDVYYNLANAYFYKRDYPTAIKYYLHVVKAKPDHDRAYNNLGGTYLILNQPQKAIESFQLARRYAPQAPDYVNNLGMAYRKTGDLERAKDLFYQAMQMKKDYFDPYLNMGRVLVAQKKVQQAIQVLSAFLRVDPNNDMAYMYLGLIWADYTDQQEKAIEYLQKSLQLAPNSQNAPSIREKIELIKKHYQKKG